MSVCCNEHSNLKSKTKNQKTSLLIGSPNIGKSSYFNKVTWQNNNVGNIDKVTINPKQGTLKWDKNCQIIDLPGTYSLSYNTIDESTVINILDKEDYDKVIGFISANNFKRDMFIILELLESNKLDHLFINMIDELTNYKLDAFKLSRKLLTDVELISCAKNTNIKQSVNSIIMFRKKEIKEFKIDYGSDIENIISRIEEIIPDNKFSFKKRFIAIQILSGNKYFIDSLSIDLNNLFPDICLLNIKHHIKIKKREFIQQLFDFCYSKIETNQESLISKTNKIDKWIFKKWIGIPLFIVILLFIYFITFYKYAGGFITEQINFGFEKLNEIINSKMVSTISNINSQWIADFVTDGLLSPIFTIIGFLPNIVIIFFLMSIMEQTGYLARISVMLDKSLNKFGISGRSIVTLITGIGCNIPSIIMSRNSQSFKERIIIVLIAPLVVCGARIIVFNWIASMLISSNFAWLVTFAITVVSIAIALFIGLFFSNTMFRNKKTFFLTELPPWRKPQLTLVFKSLGLEIWDFIKKVFTIIFILGVVTFLLSRISPTIGLINQPDYSNIDLKNASFLEYISYGLKYIFYPVGLGEDWRLSYSIIAAFPAKEAASSTLESLFAHGLGFKQTIMSFNLPISSIVSYFIFFAFYSPCFSVLATIRKEVGWKWMFIQLFSSLILAYFLSFVAYNIVGLFEKNIIVNNYISNPKNISIISLYSLLILILVCVLIYDLIVKYKNIEITYKKHKAKKYVLYSVLGIFISVSILNTFFLYS